MDIIFFIKATMHQNNLSLHGASYISFLTKQTPFQAKHFLDIYDQ
jgi:hypothetical protein